MKRYFVILLLVVNGFFGFAQQLLNHPEAYFAPAPGSEKYFYDLQEKDRGDQPDSRIQYRLDIGTAFTSFSGNGSMIYSYLSPGIRYKISPKLDLEIGGSILYTFPTSGNSYPESIGSSRNEPSYQFYLKGVYQVTDRLVIDGSFIKGYMNNNFFSQYPYSMNNEYESYTFGFNYKIGNSMHFGAQINVSNGMNPYFYSDPFYRRGTYRYDPFYREW